ncbi:MAG: pyrroline-5-carboxylate reductase [Hyphomonas sp.]
MDALLIGCGKMGGALLAQWARSEDWTFTVVDPFTESVPDGVNLFKDRESLPESSFDLMIVAVKPQMIDEIIPAYQDCLAPSGLVASIAAGCSVARLKAVSGASAVIRIMPNLPALIAQSVSGLYASPECSADQKAAVEALMQRAGTVVWVDDEDALDRVTAVAGSGPGYVFEIARTYIAAAEELGFTNSQARELVLGTMAGAVEMARQSDESVESLRNSVTSKNGTTQAGLEALNADGTLTELMRRTTQAAYDRAVELR